LGGGAILAVGIALALWLRGAGGPSGGEGSGLVERFRRKPSEAAFKAVTSFVANRAPVRKFEKAHFGDAGDDPGRLRFLLCLDKAMLPVMRDTARVGSAAKQAAWVEGYRARLAKYRTTMPPDERDRLRAALATPEGQQLVKDSVQFFYRDLSAADKATFQPIVQEVAAILSEHGAAAPSR
jgi:hypothetical protein